MSNRFTPILYSISFSQTDYNTQSYTFQYFSLHNMPNLENFMPKIFLPSLEIWMVLWYNTLATQLNRYHSRRTFGKNVRSVNHACYDKLCRNRTVLHFSVRSCWGALFIFVLIDLAPPHELTQGLPKKRPPLKGDTGGCCVGASVFHPPVPP